MSAETAGDVPRWRVIYQAMVRLDYGQVLTYREMAELLNFDARDRKHRMLMAQAARKAADELRRNDRRVAQVVRGQGYQIAEPGQVLALAHRHQTRAVAEVESGAAAVDTIDLSKLDPASARLVEATAMGFARQASIMRQMDVRQQRLETAMAALAVTTHSTATQVQQTSERVGATEDELLQLRQRIADLEAARATGEPSPSPISLSPFSGR